MYPEYMNVHDRFVLAMVQGRSVLLPITHLFDENGDNTDDPCEALSCVAGDDEVGWLTLAVCHNGCCGPVIH